MNKKIVLKFWELMEENDFYAVGSILDDNYECFWPQSNELIIGRENFALINSNYPANGKWRFTINSILAEGNQVVTDVSVTDGDIKGRAITFHEVKNNLIVKQIEFWPDSFSPPEWRKSWVKLVSE